MKKLLFFLFSLPLFSQAPPGPATTIFVGKLSCSARLFTPKQVQTWCVKGTKVVHNALHDITVGGYFEEYYGDGTPGEPWANICWDFKEENGKIKWEATWQIGTVYNSKLLSGVLIAGS
jgi:hypothetical protein